jgi:hypothetical protein
VASDDVALYLADLEQEIARARLQLDRDEFEQIRRPTFLDVTRPGAVSGLTGMLMNRPDLYGNYAGRQTIDQLNATTGAAGRFANDDRYGEFAGQTTMAGQEFVSNMAARDAQLSAEYGVPFVGGQQAPEWLAPFTTWARNFMMQNGGRIPTGTQFNQALKQGQVYDDRGGIVQPGGGAQYTADQQQFYGTTGADSLTEPGQRYAQAAVGGAVGGSPVNPAGGATQGRFPTAQPRTQAQRELEERGRATDLGVQVQREEMELRRTLGLAQIDIDRMRAEADVAATGGNLEIARSKEERANELERRAQALTEEVERRKLALQTGDMTGFIDGNETLSRIGLFGQDATGRNTLEAGVATGYVGGNATLERERLYGGAGYVGTGETLEQRTQRENAELERMRIAAGLRGPEDLVQYSRVVGGTPGGINDVVNTALGRFQPARYGDVTAPARPASYGSLAADVARGAGTGGYATGPTNPPQTPTPGVNAPLTSAQQVELATRAVGSPDQWAWQGVDRLAPTNRTMLTALAEGQGRRVEDITAARERVLGRYKGPRAGRAA